MSFTRFSYLASLGLVSAMGATQARAQTTWVDYQFLDGNTASEATPANITAGLVTNNAGLTDEAGGHAGFSTGTDSIFVRSNGTDLASNVGITADTLQLAIDNDLYSSFTVDITSGTADFRTLSFDLWDNSFSAADDMNIAFMSSLSGFTVGNELGTASPISNTASGFLFDLTNGGTDSTYEGLGVQSIEFRIYYFDDIEDNSNIYRVDNIQLTDEQQPVFTQWTFDGGGDWGTATNWSTDPNVPGVDILNDNVVIGANISDEATINMDVGAQLNSATFNHTNQLTVSGANAITLTGSAELNVLGDNLFIEADIAGTAGMTKTGGGELNIGATSYTGDTTIDGGLVRATSLDAVDNAIGRTVTVTAPGHLVLQGDGAGTGASGTIATDIAGDGQLSLSDTLTTEVVTIDSAKTFTGNVNINGGTLVVSDAGGLGLGANGFDSRTFINGGGSEGTLSITGDITVVDEYLRVQGRNADNADPALSSSGNNAWNGDIEGIGDNPNLNIEVASGTLTLGGIISGNDGTAQSYIFSGDGNTVINGAITDDINEKSGGLPRAASTSNDLSVVKQGTGTMTINTASTSPNDYWFGDTVIEGGTLEVISDGANNGELASTTIQVRSGTVLDVDHFSFYSIQAGQDLSGAGEIHAQTVGSFGDSLVSPGDSVGTLTFKGAGGVGNAALFIGSDFFDATGDRGGLDFELSSATTVGSGVNDLITGVGNLTLDVSQFDDSFVPLGTDAPIEVLITPVDGELAGGGAGTYTLIEYAGSLTQLANTSVTFAPQVQGTTEIRQSLAVDLGTSGQVNLVVSGSSANQTWTGADATNPTFWDVNTSDNWSGTDTKYFDLDNVTFNDSASSFDVAIQADVTPGSVTFDSSTGNTYTVTGAGITSGTMDLTGDVTVVLANDHAGTASTGQLTIGANATLQVGDGVTGGLNVLNNDRPIQLDGSLVMNNVANETLGGGLTGSGTLTQNSTGTVFMRGNNAAYDGNIVINDGTIQPGASADSTSLGSNVGNTTVNANGRLFLTEHVATYSENLVLNNGRFTVGGGTEANIDWSGGVNLGTAGTSNIQLNGNTDTFDELDNRLTNGLTISGNVTGVSGGNLAVQVDGGSTLVVSGNLAHDGSLTKTSGGTLELQGTNSYTGDTNVEAGSIALIGASSIPSAAINLDGGAVDSTDATSGEFSLASGQTLKLGGDGSLSSSQVTVSFDATQDNRISYDPTDPDSDGTNTPNFQNRVGINSGGAEVARSVINWDISSLFDSVVNVSTVDAVTIEVLDNSQAVDGSGGSGHTLELIELTKNFEDGSVNASQASLGDLWTGYTVNGDADPNAAGAGDFGLLLGTQVGLVPGADTANPVVFADNANMRTAVETAVLANGNNVNVILKLSDADEASQLGTNSFYAFDDADDTTPPALNVTVTGDVLAGIGSGTITGDFSPLAGSIIEVDLYSITQFDSLNITGALNAGGTLDVNLITGAPALADGDSFDIFDFASATGSFGTINLPTLAGGLTWDTTSLLVDGVLSVTASALVGDLNGDGFVGIADLNIVLGAWNQNVPPGNPLADPSGDGFVGIDDLNTVLGNWNAGTPPTGNAAIPEPASLALLGMGAVAMLRRRK